MEIEQLVENDVIYLEGLILDQIKHLELTLEQSGFLLLFYRHTKKNGWLLPSGQQFSQIYNIDGADVKRLQHFLFQKGYCEIETRTDGATLVEYVNWRLLYDRLSGKIVSQVTQDTPLKVEIGQLVEREFGRMLSPMEIELAGIWSKNYKREDIIDAIKEAVLSDVKNMKYIDKILLNWSMGKRRQSYETVQNDAGETNEIQLDGYYNWLEEK